MSYTLAYTGAEIDALLGKIDAIFVAEYGSTIYSEVTAAIAAGNKVIVANAGKVFVYAGTDDNSGYVFTQSGPKASKPNATYVTLSTGNVWSTATVDLATLQQFYDSFMTDTASGSIASFPDGAENVPIKELTAQITAQQDLHGQSAPYPLIGGRNKLPMTLAGMKAANTSGTWTGNSYALNGITAAVTVDSGGNVTGINVSGTASGAFALNVGDCTVSNIGNILNGCPSGGSSSTYRLGVYISGSAQSLDDGSGVTIPTIASTAQIEIRITSGYAISGTLTFYPMIRLSTDTDTSFASPTNYCPISGYTGAEIYNAPKIPQSEIIAGTISGTSLTTRCHYVPTNDYVEAGTKIRILRASSGARVGIGVYSDASHTTSVYDSGWKFTANEDIDITITVPNSGYVVFGFANQTNTFSTITPQEVAACGFVAYLSPVVEIDWTDEAGTVYGGYFKVNEDGSVDLTPTHKTDNLGNLSWYQIAGTTSFYTNSLTDSDYVTTATKNDWLSSAYAVASSVTGNSQASGRPDFAIFGKTNSVTVYVNDSRYNSAADFKTGVTGQTIWYNFTNPQTYHLASIVELKTLLGDNNIFADCGDVEVEYRCNTALYIEKKLGE